MLAEVFYYKNKISRNVGLGSKWMEQFGLIPTVLSLEENHKKVYEINVPKADFSPEVIFHMLNTQHDAIDQSILGTENEDAGHTSMSVGDVILFDGVLYLADMFGFMEIA